MVWLRVLSSRSCLDAGSVTVSTRSMWCRGGSWWFAVVSRWFAVVCGGLWWFAVVHGGSRWFMVVRGGLRWFAVVVSRWFMVVRGRVAVVRGSSRWRRGGCPMCLVVPLTGSARSQVALEHLS